MSTSRRFGRGGGWNKGIYQVVFDGGPAFNSYMRRDSWYTQEYTMSALSLDPGRDYIQLIDQSRVMGVSFSNDVNDRINVYAGNVPVIKDVEYKMTTSNGVIGVLGENCLIVARDPNAKERTTNSTRIFITDGDLWDNRLENDDGWFFTIAGDGYAGFKIAGDSGYTVIASLYNNGYYLEFNDIWAPVVIQMGEAKDYSYNFEQFKDSVKARQFDYVDGKLSYEAISGDTYEYWSNSTILPKINDTTFNFNPGYTYINPYLSLKHGEDTINILYPGYPDLKIPITKLHPTTRITYDDTINRFTDTLWITLATSVAMDPAVPMQISMSGAAELEPTDMLRVNDTLFTFEYPIPKADGEVTIRLGNGTDLFGNEIDSIPLSGGTFSIIRFMPGDVDDDGEVLANDAALTLEHSVGMDPLPETDPLPWEPWRDSTANVDGEGIITAYDAGLILQYSVGIESFSSVLNSGNVNADVYIEQQGKDLIFFSSEDLHGLNINVKTGLSLLGTPEFLQEELLTAVNVNDVVYRIGACTANPPEAGSSLLSIPIVDSGPVEFEVMVNNEDKTLTMDLLTEIESNPEDSWRIYPNPTDEIIHISGMKEPAILEIHNLYGSLVKKSYLGAAANLIDVGNLNGGLYLFRFITGEAETIRKVMVK
ncbi:MAG: T9SS type A sorting domain-containing protein [Bacteroidales bacterium]|nr:T9SS type A sorting domain-containing protein [Bacteroidales bacterium]